MIRYSPFDYDAASLPPTEAVRRVLASGHCPPIAEDALRVTLAWCMVRDEAESLASAASEEARAAFAAERP